MEKIKTAIQIEIDKIQKRIDQLKQYISEDENDPENKIRMIKIQTFELVIGSLKNNGLPTEREQIENSYTSGRWGFRSRFRNGLEDYYNQTFENNE